MPSSPQKNRAPFVGREAEIETLREALREPGLVTLLGPGGVGKTRLVGELVARDPTFDPCFLWLDEIASDDDIVALMARAVGIAPTGEADFDRVVAILLDEPQRLLVIDNAEHVVESARAVVERLPLDRLRVLITSRVALDLPFERRVRVPVLPLSDARELLSIRAEMLGVALGDDDHDTLLEALDCLPLAIELAAARTTILSPAQILARLHESNQIVASNSTTRHGALDRTIAWSWALLEGDERRIAATVAMFDQPIDPSLAEGMWPDLDVYSLAQRLESRSWLRVVDGPRGRKWSTLWAMRRFVAHHLDDDARDEQRERLRAWALAHLDEQPGWWSNHVPTALAAAHDAIEDGDHEGAAGLLSRSFFGAFGGPYFPGLMDTAARLLQTWSSDENPAVWASLAAKMAKGAFRLSGRYRALDWSERAVEAAPAGTVARLTSAAQHVLCLVDDNRRDAAEALLDQLVEERALFPQDMTIASALLDLATAAHEMGRFEITRSICETVEEIGRAAGSADARARAWIHLCYASYDLGEFERAAAEIRQLERLLDDRHPDEAATVGGVVPPMVDLQMGRDDEARRALEELERLARAMHYHSLEFFVALGWAEWAARNAPDETGGHLDRALALAKLSGSKKSVAHAGFLLALDDVEQRRFDDARARIADLGSQRTPASPTHWSDALDAADWFCRVQRGEALAAPSTTYGELFAAVHASVRSLDPAPLDTLLRDRSPALWNIPGLYLLRLDDVARRWYARFTAGTQVRRLCIEPNGHRFQFDGEPVNDMSRRGALRRILVRLANERVDTPGKAVSMDDVIEAGWPDEQILYEAALTRVYTTMNRLRALGFGPWLVTVDDGYVLDVALDVEIVEDLRSS